MAAAADADRDAAVALAKKQLSAKLEVAADSLELDKAEAVDWPDASLGCPEKGMMYAQMLTPGHKVSLKSGGKTYAVHVGGGRAVVCDGSRRAGASPPPARK
jgi:hypothetical protein